MVRWIVIGIAGLALCGCFALDEIDSGQEIMDQHYGHHAKADSDEPEPPPAEEPPGFVDRARAWIAGLGKSDERARPQDDSLPPDPKNILVRCSVRGSVEFTRKYSCQLKGGKVLGPLNSAAR